MLFEKIKVKNNYIVFYQTSIPLAEHKKAVATQPDPVLISSRSYSTG